MIDFNHEIRSLLFEHDYVTIPGLGAFIAHYEPSNYDGETNSFTPPNRRISFNSVLKQDDGLLTSVVMKKVNLSSKKAKELINSYVKELKSSLIDEKSIELSGVGNFELTSDQKIIFSPTKQNFYNESYGFETLYSFNSANFTYTGKYFEEATETQVDSYEFETMNITLGKSAKKPFFSKVLYAAPLIVLTIGLCTVLIFNPSTEKNALSSLNPIDYFQSAKSWFSGSKEKLDVNQENKQVTKSVIINAAPVVEEEVFTERLVVGIFSNPENANRLYNKLVLNDFDPEIDFENDKSVIFFPVNENTDTELLSKKLQQFIGEKGVIVKNK